MIRHLLNLFCLLSIFCPHIGATDLCGLPFIPKPQSIETGESFAAPKIMSVEMPFRQENWEELFQSKGIEIKKDVTDRDYFHIKGEINDTIPNPEGYILTVSDKGINVEAKGEKGFYWALTTLEKLIREDRNGKVYLTECRISDYPSFPYRGLLIDCGRAYISLRNLKRVIEEMSRMKLNVFHWHLTENQGWRLESKIYPQLNDSDNMLRDKGLFYTQEEAKELLRLAKAHNVEVIPEIDMPGHSAAFTKTFGFDMQSPEGVEVLKNLLDEAVEVFEDCEYFHIGTDEVKFTNPHFANEMVEYLRKKGKKVMAWNPGYNYKPGEIDMLQLWSYRGKPLKDTKVIDSKFHYINHFDTYADIRALYRSKVLGEEKATDFIIGPEICLWNDRYVDNEDLIFTENNLYPLILAMAERSWLGGGTEYFDGLGTNMGDPESGDFKEFEDFENRLLIYKSTFLDDLDTPYVKQANVKWIITDAFPNEGELSAIFPPETQGIENQYEYKGQNYRTRETSGAGVYLRHVWGEIIPGFYENPLPNHTAYAMTRVYSPCEQTVGLQFETQNYSRSEPDLPPPPGKWDFRESKLWINGVEILPPEWTANHTLKDNEIPLGNENMTSRSPLPVTLREGWNDVIIKLPVGEFSTPETRLVKWMFTFVFTTPDGKSSAPGLIYQPSGEIL